MKHRFLLIPILSLLAVALSSPASGQPALFYVNDAVVQAPPQIPPQVDAINFVNNSYFSITFTNLDYSGDTLSYNAVLFQPVDCLNFTNFSYMSVNAGINFLTVPSGAGQERMAANFFNPGVIYVGSDTNLVIVGPNALFYPGLPQLRVQATNIFNPGAIVVGYDGLCSFNGQTVDLSRGSLMMTNSGTSIFNSVNNVTLASSSLFNAGVFDGYWGIGTNLFSLYDQFVMQNPPTTPFHVVTPRDYTQFDQELTLAADGLSYWDVTSAGNTFLIQAAFVNNTNSAFAPKVYFIGGYTILEWSQTVTNSDGTTQPQYLYVLDDLPDLPVAALGLNGFAGAGVGRPTYIPNNFEVFENPGPLFGLGLPSTPSALPQNLTLPVAGSAVTIPFFPTDDTSNIWTAYEALLPPVSIILSDVAGQDVTNIPGRIEVSAAKTLDLTMAQITSLNYLSLQATNQFLGSSNAQIAAPFADFNLRSTNGLLSITNLIKSTIRQPEGQIDLWSTCTTNVYTIVVYGTNAYITNFNHVLFVDARVAPTLPSRTESLVLTSTNTLGGDDNLVIHDVFHITRDLHLDASRITIATNAPGSPIPAGALYLENRSVLWPDTTPRLLFLTNSGAFRTYNAVFFGGSRTTPFYNTNLSVPYAAFVNHGFITNNGSLIWANDFENSGLITAPIGDIRLEQSQYALLTNGFLFAINGTIALNSGSLFASNTLFQAGAGLSLAPTNVLTDGISNLALVYQANPIYPTNYLNGVVTNGNSWSAGNGGLSLLAKPATGDLLGTTITLNATFNTSVPITWAGADLGVSTDGFLNNAALGRLVLKGASNSVFSFTGAAPSGNAIYVDDLELQGFTATASDTSGDFTGLSASNIKVYYAQARANGIEIAEKLDGRNGGGFIWVSNYNWGYFSSTNLLYPDGLLHRVNAALASSGDLVSNPTNTVVNRQSQAPISPVIVPPTNGVPTDVPLHIAINLAPQGQTVVQGSSATFNVAASSDWPLSYQWQLNSNNIAGAIYPSFTVSSAQPADAGDYSVVVTSFAGSIVSPPAILTVTTAPVPVITAQPQNLTVAQGGTALFSVTASGAPPLSYQWRFNGLNIAGGTASVYSKTNVQPTDAGQYAVTVSSTFGFATSSNATLTISVGAPSNSIAKPAILPPLAALSAQSASANAFSSALGSYYGLFSDTNGASAASSGGFAAKVTTHGAYSAKLTLGGRSYSASGSFSANTPSTASATISRGSGLAPLTLKLLLDLSGGGQMLGSVAAGADWSATLQAYRAAPAAASPYTLVIPSATPALGASPAGYGFGTITVDGLGNLLFAGALADGTKVSQSAMRSKDGYWPLFASLYAGSGCLLSWLEFTDTGTNACDGQLIWLNNAGATPKTYPAGFTNLTTALGSLYSAAAFTGGTLVLSDGESTDATDPFSVDTHKRVHPTNAASKLSLTFTTSSGLFKGTTWSPELRQTLSFQGVICGQGANGFGYYFLDPQQNGKVLLDLAQ
jgi:hypothetical protein